jgi:hypothetical protein
MVFSHIDYVISTIRRARTEKNARRNTLADARQKSESEHRLRILKNWVGHG